MKVVCSTKSADIKTNRYMSLIPFNGEQISSQRG